VNGWDGLVAVLSAAIGSFFGAYGAQWIVEREGRRRRAIDDLRSTNTAIVLSSFALNTVLDLRRQHLAPLVERFENDKKRAEAILKAGQGHIAIQADYQEVSLPRIPIDKLSDTVLYRVNLSNRALSIANLAFAALSHLSETLDQRNEFTREVRDNPGRDDQERIMRYLGLPYMEGHTDARYPSYISAIKSYTADAAMFFAVLIDELMQHSQHVVGQLKKKPWEHDDNTVVTPRNIDMSHAFREGSIPQPSEYAALLGRLGFNPEALLKEDREKATQAE
jgi:hypothetical protein